ncbi:MAG: phosphoglycerate dehydrogenase [Gammaproteobacteria bacterium]|nr:phosphoglycerate dehydrogenase [Gammaproteobacteria bacterium]MDH3448154.1 phosphoglycerate dehydrogenase [Gammaproteobacteria bacterium]
MTKPRVLISDSMSSQAVQVFEERGVEVVQSSKLSEAELYDLIGDFDGLAIRSSTKVTAELLENAKNLKVVGRAGIGVDNVDVTACTRRGIVVMNTPLGNAITTAEHAMAMMLALARHIPQANSSTHAGKWEKARFMGVELTGKTLGLIGAGNIGSIVAEKAIGYGLHVQAYDPFLTEERADKLRVKKVDLDTLLASSDIVSLHVPKTPETSNIIGASAINKMKKGSMLINCARGGLVDELALKAALESGHIKGAALDVYEVEPARDNPLFELDNVICTPHLGASTIEAQEKVAIQIAEQISSFLLTGAVNNAINAPSISAEEAQLLRPYLQLAQCLGSFVGQLTHDPIKTLSVTYGGEANDLNVSPLTLQVVQSVLEHHSSYVNSVNAREVARERNIDVIEAHNEGRDEYPCRITVGVETETRSRSICGTLIQHRPRVIDVKGIPLESELGEHMLYITNYDKPGVIGDIGTSCAQRGINIANMHLGRDARNGKAMVLLEIDEPLGNEDLEHLRSLPNINDVQYLHFPAIQ